MESRLFVSLLVLLSAVLFVHAVSADLPVESSDHTAVVTAVSSVDSLSHQGSDAALDVNTVDEEENLDQTFGSEDEHDLYDSFSTHPLARILHERSSKHCWSSNHCKKHFKKAGCCNKKCVNLATDTKNCGRCGKCCDTRKGYCCVSGKCVKHGKTPQCTRYKKCKSGFVCRWNKCVRKPQCSRYQKCRSGYRCKNGKCVKVVIPQSCKSDKNCRSGYVCRYGKCVKAVLPKECSSSKHCKSGYECKYGKCVKKPNPPVAQCGAYKKCSNGHTCCKGKCVNLKNNPGHCGKCDKGCGYGSKCCHGKCLNVKHDVKNCGECGRRCGFGRVCCHGYCKNIHGSDNHHCGACGKKCTTQCKFGMCGYGL